MILSCYVLAADMDETWRLWHTIDIWWPEIEVLITHRVTNARTEAAKGIDLAARFPAQASRRPGQLPSRVP
jgi:transposase